MIVDIALLKKYDKAGPRYTSYPTAPYFHDGVGEKVFIDHIQKDNDSLEKRDLSLYFHIPFCDTLCYFCGCNMMVSRNQNKINEYLVFLEKEIKLLKSRLDPSRKVIQMHWGGGTPTHLSPDQIRKLGKAIRDSFEFQPNAEVSVEIDPRELTRAHMEALADAGFNRCSMGIQDFEPKVQKAVNRIQTQEVTEAALGWARDLNFNSMNLDLMYGLPHQTTATFADTIDKVIAMNPDRLAVFNYAHLPSMIKHQQLIHEEWLPTVDQKLELLKLSIEKLSNAGFIYIGMDHFAKPDDELTVAMNNGTLYRNFQGYSTHAGINLLAMGITSISMLSDLYIQNQKKMDDYYRSLNDNQLPVMRGVILNAEDQLRRDVITELMCNFRISKASFEQKYKISFNTHFSEALDNLKAFEGDGLISLTHDELVVTQAGRLLIRNIAMNFDEYLMKKQGEKPRFSRTV